MKPETALRRIRAYTPRGMAEIEPHDQVCLLHLSGQLADIPDTISDADLQAAAEHGCSLLRQEIISLADLIETREDFVEKLFHVGRADRKRRHTAREAARKARYTYEPPPE